MGCTMNPDARCSGSCNLSREMSCNELRCKPQPVLQCKRQRGLQCKLQHELQGGLQCEGRGELLCCSSSCCCCAPRAPAISTSSWGRWRRPKRLREILGSPGCSYTTRSVTYWCTSIVARQSSLVNLIQ